MVLTRSAFSAICLVLVLQETCSVDVPVKIVPAVPIEKFGCAFQNANYFVRTKSEYDPVYGREVEPLEIANETEFQGVLDVINREYATMIAEVVFDNSPTYFDLFDAYVLARKQLSISVYDFYRKYIPKFPRQECTGMSVEILDRLVRAYPRMRSNVHVVTSTVYAQKELLQVLGIEENEIEIQTADVQQSDNFDLEPPKFWFLHNHAAAVVRFRLGGNRLGYVLMDPGLGIAKPVVVMEDGNPPLVDRVGKGKVEIKFTLPSKQYMVGTYSSGANKNVYYIAKPYCSFLMTTTKAHLTETTIYVVRRDTNGVALGYLIFDPSEENPEFKMSVRTRVEDHYQQQRVTVKFGQRDFSILNKDEQEIYNLTVNTFNYRGLEDLMYKAEVTSTHEKFQKSLGTLRRLTIQKLKANYYNY